jgi:hypothetical protein
MYLFTNGSYINNIYLYYKLTQPILCKYNFAYQITSKESYNKIISLLSYLDLSSSINITNSNKLKLSINPTWSIKTLPDIVCSTDQPLKRNVLLPSLEQIELAPNITDLNPINCLCHDQTRIVNLPDIILKINDNQYNLTQWTGNNQVWCSFSQSPGYYLYAYLYIFYHRSILLISQTSKDPDIDHHLDLDLSSIYEHNNIIQDEYGRIDCGEYNPNFNSVKIMNTPSNINESLISIETISKCQHIA